MSYEPRSRGMRPRRITSKKTSSKEAKKERDDNRFAYQEFVPVDPKAVSSRAMNALDHLGNQRFGMPPFSEHFHRWILDVESVLNEFKSSLPTTPDDAFDASIRQQMDEIRTELQSRISAEENLSSQITELRQQLADNERGLTELDSQHRTKVHEAKRSTEKSVTKLRGEINALDEQRLKLLRQTPGFLERIFGRNKTKVEDSSRSLNSKRSDLLSREEKLKHHIDDLRSDYAEKRKPLTAQQAELKKKLAFLRSTTVDDALEVRKAACEQMRQAISAALNPTQQEQTGSAKEV